jgi:death-on-curing family protein
MSEIQIYKSVDNEIEIEVKFDNETVWLSQDELSILFQRDQSVISRHIKNIFEEELAKESNMHFLHIPNSDKPIKIYNLDVIISVGYRVKSKQGTQFRQWATQRLKDYLIKGQAINFKRLEELKNTINFISDNLHNENLLLSEAKGLLEIIQNYTQSFVLLNQFDSNNLDSNNLNEHITYEIKYEEADSAILRLKEELIIKKEATNLFGNQKDESFKGILGNIIQSFDGYYLYQSIEEQAAHLLYFIIKNHPFSDGNKRIGAFMFVWFLEKNKHQFKNNGEVKINDNALVVLALLVAQSDPNDKDLMIKLILNLIKN